MKTTIMVTYSSGFKCAFKLEERKIQLRRLIAETKAKPQCLWTIGKLLQYEQELEKLEDMGK